MMLRKDFVKPKDCGNFIGVLNQKYLEKAQVFQKNPIIKYELVLSLYFLLDLIQIICILATVQVEILGFMKLGQDAAT